MANNLNQSLDHDNSIDLKEILKILSNSKKLLISTILIFTTASIIYSLSLKSSYISSMLMEIGSIEMNDGTLTLIETPDDLISDLKILVLKNPDNKFNQNVSMDLKEGKIIKFETTSSSIEQNENLLASIFNHIDERQSNIDKLTTDINFDITNTEAEITYFKSKLSDEYQSQYLKIISNLSKEDEAKESLRLLEQNSKYRDKLFFLNQTLEKLKIVEDKNSFKVKSKSQIIVDVKTNEIKPKTQLIIFLGSIVGFFTGISLALIRNFVKA